MRFREYLSEKLGVILLQLGAAWAFFVFLAAVGMGIREIGLILLAWFLLLAGWFGFAYWRQKRYLQELFQTLEALDKPYLLTQVMKNPSSWEGRQYWRVMEKVLKSMTEQVGEAQERQREYQEYIEQWVHEIKLPVAAAQLICENEKTNTTRRILGNLEQIDGGIEQVLYMARMRNPEQDYSIRPVILEDCVFQVVTGCRESLRQIGVSVETKGLDKTVGADRKWLEFILRQIMANSLKYPGENPCIHIEAVREGHAVLLSVEDNGQGIPQSELGRIFEKGFTGSNGRGNKESTGMGLYICRELCRKLGMGIRAESEEGKYTRVILVIPEYKGGV